MRMWNWRESGGGGDLLVVAEFETARLTLAGDFITAFLLVTSRLFLSGVCSCRGSVAGARLRSVQPFLNIHATIFGQ